MKHTPTPWKFYDDQVLAVLPDKSNRLIATCRTTRVYETAEAENSANASFIVRCVNNHYDLLKALKLMIANPKENLQWAKEVIEKAESNG